MRMYIGRTRTEIQLKGSRALFTTRGYGKEAFEFGFGFSDSRCGLEGFLACSPPIAV